MFFFNDQSNENLKFEPGGIEHGYLAILNDDLDTAEKVFEFIDSPRARWACILVQILRGYLRTMPTYFQVRNFLEIDLDFLLKNEKLDYVEQILGSLDILTEVNQECYKYAARVLYENKIFNASKQYLDKSKKIFYKDPELHFILAKYYLKTRDYTQANFYVDECLKLIPDYYPAKLIKKELEKYLA